MLSVEVGNDLGVEPFDAVAPPRSKLARETGTKYACHIAKRGACTIILDGDPCLQTRVGIARKLERAHPHSAPGPLNKHRPAGYVAPDMDGAMSCDARYPEACAMLRRHVLKGTEQHDPRARR